MKERNYRPKINPEELQTIKENTLKALEGKTYNAYRYIREFEKQYIKLRGREE